jgi:hypothetical protein
VPCPCGALFASQAALARHLASGFHEHGMCAECRASGHGDGRQFLAAHGESGLACLLCDVCGGIFAGGALDMHKVREHGVDIADILAVEGESKDQGGECELCESALGHSDLGSLCGRHGYETGRVHGCGKCERLFDQKRWLTKHAETPGACPDVNGAGVKSEGGN